MIRTQEMVPDWYIEKSRDFQVLCRLFDYNVNSLKFNIDITRYLTDTGRTLDTVLPLIGDKFGIYDKEAYSNRELLEALPIAIKQKGALHSISTLLNAFMNSMEVFEYAVAFHSKDEESAKELSELLRRTVKPYSVIIVLSSFPGLTNIHVLDTYLRMVVPTGMIIEYSFGEILEYFDKFEYQEYVFFYKVSPEFLTQIKGSSDQYQASNVITSAGFDANAQFIGKVNNNIDINTVEYASVASASSKENDAE